MFGHEPSYAEMVVHSPPADVRRCALGSWEEDAKTRWEEVSEGLKAELREHLKQVASAYPTSIAFDNVWLR